MGVELFYFWGPKKIGVHLYFGGPIFILWSNCFIFGVQNYWGSNYIILGFQKNGGPLLFGGVKQIGVQFYFRGQGPIILFLGYTQIGSPIFLGGSNFVFLGSKKWGSNYIILGFQKKMGFFLLFFGRSKKMWVQLFYF